MFFLGAFMRTLVLLLLLIGLIDSALAADLHARCVAAVAANGVVSGAGVKETMAVPMGENGSLYQFTDPSGGVFSCQVCDDDNPANHACGSMGLDLSYRPKDGELRRLPAELDKKCVYFLQKEVKPRGEELMIDHAIAKRIQVTPNHTDTRWFYQMELDGKPYRCVIRKSDGNFRVESQKGDDWRPIAAGTMF
jgi:hypothetical protein